jgi:hypothetical protein
MFEKEQPYPSFWSLVASTIRGDNLSKRQKRFRTVALAFVFLALVRLLHQ